MITKSPLFIVGCGRSGTSLLRAMLNHHPQIAIPLESLFIIDYLKAPKKISLNVLKKFIINETEIKEWGLELNTFDVSKCRSRKELIDTVNIVYMKANGKIVWGQKTPRFIRFWKLLKKVYPKSKFIHLIRDPRATVNSLKKSNVHFSNCLYAARRWNLDVKYGLEMKKEHPSDVLEIRYADLIRNTKRELDKVCKFIGVHYSNKMMEYYSTGHKEYSYYFSKIHRSLNSKPDIRLIDKWKEELSSKEIELIESVNKKLMQRLGFILINKNPKKDRLYIFLMRVQRVVGLIKQFLNYLRFRRTFFICNLRRKCRFGLLLKDIKSINY